MAAIEDFVRPQTQSGKNRARSVEHWKERLLRCWKSRLLAARLVVEGQSVLDALAVEVAERKKGPYAPSHELLSRVGI